MRTAFVILTHTLICLGDVTLAQSAGHPPTNRAEERVGSTIADRPTEHYTFETRYLDSADGRRHYRVQIGTPTNAPTAQRATLYMLDGDAAIASLTPGDLAMLNRCTPPVLVAIGYDVPTRNDVVARAFDYTPPVVENDRVTHPVVRGRVGGGADLFLQFIEERIRPLVRDVAPGNGPDLLWGHSYGGLFALHVLFTRPETFSGYIVGDPSVWWHNGALLNEWAAFDSTRAAGKRVDFLVGTKPRHPQQPPPPDAGILERNGERINLRKAVQDMADQIGTHASAGSYQTFPQHGHGEMIRVSLEHALRVAACGESAPAAQAP